jgi:hypothetical protein
MLIQHLPAPIRTMAVKYWIQHRDLYNLRVTEEHIDAAYCTHLNLAFIWEKTDETETYWRLCNEERFKEAKEYLANLQKSKADYMMDGQPIYTEAVPTTKKHNLKPLPTMGATSRTLLAVLIGGVVSAALIFIQTILQK